MADTNKKTKESDSEWKLRVIGEWENRRSVPEPDCVTWHYPDFGVYVA